jgi:tripartite-type tricarboxylate transporter receptor subunit TctC
MQTQRTWKHLSRLFLTGLTAAGVAGAANAAGKYPEKPIELVVGYKPGGGYGDLAQAIAPFIEKHLPNKANVVVRNMDGAGNVVAANYLHKAKPDGYTIGLYNVVGLALNQVSRKSQYDLAKTTWLARINVDNVVALVNGKGPYNSILDFKKQAKPEYIVSIRGISDNNTLAAAVTFDKMKVKWKPLNHEGASNAILSVIRGDADLILASYESFQQYIDSGDVKPILYYDTKRFPRMPDTPIPAEIGMPELAEAMNTQRMIGAPPGLPADVRQVLETAIRQAVEDPGFIELMKKTRKSIVYLDGKESEKVVKGTLETYKSYSGVINDLLNRGK